MKLPSAETRQWAYRVLFALVPIFAAFGYIAPEDVSLWLNLASALCGVSGIGLANTTLKQQRADGIVTD